MNRIAMSSLTVTAGAVILALGLPALRGGDDAKESSMAVTQGPDRRDKIANAESAGPDSIGREAAVLDYPAEGTAGGCG